MKIGILQTDRVRDEFIEEFGDYPAMFEQLLYRCAAHVQPSMTISIDTFEVQQGTFPVADNYDGFVITGSRDSVYDDFPWIAELVEFLRGVHEKQQKIVGICFGHQLMAHYFGGETTVAEIGWSVGVKTSRMLAGADWMQPERKQFNLLSSHKDQVSHLPENARIFASSEFCPIAGFTLGEHVLTFQGHPEFSKAYSAALMQTRREILGESTYHEGMTSLDESLDAEVIGQWMLNFLRT